MNTGLQVRLRGTTMTRESREFPTATYWRCDGANNLDVCKGKFVEGKADTVIATFAAGTWASAEEWTPTKPRKAK